MPAPAPMTAIRHNAAGSAHLPWLRVTIVWCAHPAGLPPPMPRAVALAPAKPPTSALAGGR